MTPMEPTNYPQFDPGPKALLTTLSDKQNIDRLEWILGRGVGYVGVVNYMGSRFTRSHSHMRVVLSALRKRGLLYLESHSAMRNVAGPRVELATRTIFNILGPLSNPSLVKRQMTGVFAPQWTEPMAEVLGNLGLERAWVVHAHDGSDELTTTGPAKVSELKDGKVTTYEVSPEDAGLERSTLDDIKGGDSEYNAAALHALLAGTPSAFRDCVVLTAVGSLMITGKTADLKSGVTIAQNAIDSGAAQETLARLVEITNRDNGS